jgi:general stress protein 26
MVQPNLQAKAVLDTIKYITVATSNKDGEPWNTPVAGFHFDGDYTLYWASWQDNQHSQNIRANGKAFVVVYDSPLIAVSHHKVSTFKPRQ